MSRDLPFVLPDVTAARPLENAPGQRTLAFRFATREQLLAWMLRRLHVQPAGKRGQHLTPLAALNVQSEGGLIRPLLDGWATICDVIGFYQERILNEGFLGTATDRESLLYLCETIGYQPRAASEAGAHLVFDIADRAGGSTVPAGTIIHGVPDGGDVPQVFETTDDLDARAEWIDLAPHLPAEPSLPGDTTWLLLEGREARLRPGQPLLVVGRVDGAEERLPVTVASVATLSPRQVTVVQLQAPLRPGSDGAAAAKAVTAPAVYAFDTSTQLFGFDLPPWATAKPAVKAQLSPRRGGVAASAPTAPAFAALNAGLPDAPVLSLLLTPDGSLLAGTDGQGVYRRPIEPAQASATSAGLARQRVFCLTTTAAGQILAGTAGGAFRSTDDGETWEALSGRMLASGGFPFTRIVSARLPVSVVRALLYYETGHGRRRRAFIAAATDAGVYVTEDGANAWMQRSTGLGEVDRTTGQTAVSVRGLALDAGRHRLVAATDRGVFITRLLGNRWRAWNRGLPAREATALARLADGTLLLGTRSGLFARGPKARAWHALSGLGPAGTPPVVTALAVAAGPAGTPERVFAVTEAGLFASGDRGASWSPFETGLTNTSVKAITAGSEQVVCAAPFDGFVDDDWPGLPVTGDTLALARVEPSLAELGWLLLRQLPDRLVGRAVTSVATVQHAAFAQRARVTSVTVEPPLKAGEVDRRQVEVYGASRRLPLTLRQIQHASRVPAEPRARRRALRDDRTFDALVRPPVTSADQLTDRVVLASPVTGLTGRLVMVRGRAFCARLADPNHPLVLYSPAHLQGERPTADELLQVVGWEREGQTLSYDVASATGFRAMADVTALVLLPAPADAKELAETAVVQSATVVGQTTELALSKPLATVFDPATVRVDANVVWATHGRRVEALLGSGNAAIGNQRFELQGPQPTAFGEPIANSVQVLVDGLPWTRVETLYAAKPDAFVYELRRSPDGRLAVVFGDGVHGARVPTGVENVTATYRVGAGQAGNLGQRRLQLIQSPSAAVVGATNPAPASGGASEESNDELRRNAPRSIRALGRIVALSDFEDVVSALPGISQALTSTLWSGRAEVIHLTVAGTDAAQTYAVGPAALAAVHAAIDAARGSLRSYRVQSFAPRFFDVDAVLTVRAGLVEEALLKSARAALMQAFAFERRRLAHGVSASDIMAVLQPLPGVLGVTVDRLAYAPVFDARPESTGAPPDAGATDPGFLVARAARWDRVAGGPLPAELLFINARSGIRLTAARFP